MGENMASIQYLQDDPAEEAEEALSLCDLALDLDANGNSDNDLGKLPAQSRRSSSEAAPEFFEFLSDVSSDMCPADDIIFCGKLIPLKQQPVSFQRQKGYPSDEKRKNHVLRKRSESLSELRSSSMTRSSSTKNTTLLRNSRSLDYQKLHRYEMERNPSTRSAGKTHVLPKKAVKPRWYVFMFGMVKFPPEMELQDIKSRQFGRSPSVMFPPMEDGGKKFAGNRCSGKGSSWSLLKALSCRDHTSVAVTASFWMPQA
ncbi:PREDICTED: uncharacterized protein LOC18589263 [Theobroma cacao]|uniref:Uncharacterized protein LOC18589263 n=1 Tax=Theobroma cacao TaxID=3641 RepID=A0AB32X2M2_THECC|nr:PREDICTED: uncharacterized protein LOC18589263 [Theobroma cacao]